MRVKAPKSIQSLKKIFVLVVFGILMLSLVKNISRVFDARERVHKEALRLEKAQEKNAELLRQVAKVQSGAYVEKQAYEKLGLVKDTEIVLVLPEEEVLRKLSPHIEDKQNITESIPNWKKWIDLLL